MPQGKNPVGAGGAVMRFTIIYQSGEHGLVSYPVDSGRLASTALVPFPDAVAEIDSHQKRHRELQPFRRS